MPIVKDTGYKPHFLLRNGHINTFYPYFFRKRPSIPYIRKRIKTDDGDFFDVDWLLQTKNRRLAILLHGLEGSSSSQYIGGTSLTLSRHAFDIAAINFRSCSGEMNLNPCMYHSGFTKDLHLFVQLHQDHYDEIFICGFSLGGNVAMKYAGDQHYVLSDKIKAITGISVPCDLRAGSIKLRERQNRLYELKFLETLLKKVKKKHEKDPDTIDIQRINDVKSLWDFDDFFTAPLHGFADAEDYYRRCNSKQFLKNISIPALMINAADDTFLPDESYPYEEATKNQNLFLLVTKYGGHVGFTTFGTPYYWNETRILEFCTQYSNVSKPH